MQQKPAYKNSYEVKERIRFPREDEKAELKELGYENPRDLMFRETYRNDTQELRTRFVVNAENIDKVYQGYWYRNDRMVIEKTYDPEDPKNVYKQCVNKKGNPTETRYPVMEAGQERVSAGLKDTTGKIKSWWSANVVNGWETAKNKVGGATNAVVDASVELYDYAAENSTRQAGRFLNEKREALTAYFDAWKSGVKERKDAVVGAMQDKYQQVVDRFQQAVNGPKQVGNYVIVKADAMNKEEFQKVVEDYKAQKDERKQKLDEIKANGDPLKQQSSQTLSNGL